MERSIDARASYLIGILDRLGEGETMTEAEDMFDDELRGKAEVALEKFAGAARGEVRTREKLPRSSRSARSRSRRLPPRASSVSEAVGARARPHEPRSAPGQPPQHPCLLVGRPHLLEIAGGQQPRECASVEAVGLGLRLADRRELRVLATTTRATWGKDMAPILYWNDVSLEANRVSHNNRKNEQTGPTRSSRALAIVHLAMYDAFVGVSGSLTPLSAWLARAGTSFIAKVYTT